MDVQQFEDYLTIGIEENYTDITMVEGRAPIFGDCDRYWEWPDKPLSKPDIKLVIHHLTETKGFNKVEDNDGCDVSYEITDEDTGIVTGRFRISIYKSMGDYCLSIRVIPTKPLDYNQLNLPIEFTKLAQLQRGLILVTGATGQGKSTTISALINEINRTRTVKIITIEDPIEFTYPQDKAFIIHREIGLDVSTYQVAIKQALRQRPNVIMVGEIRDKETLDAVMLAAQTGHLVISSIHTTDVKTTLSEIVGYYGSDNQGLNRLISNLAAIISQRLLRRKENVLIRNRNIIGKNAKVSVIPACEVLFMSESVKEAIKKQELDKLTGLMENGDYYGMQNFDKDICRLYSEDEITKETALSAVSSKEVIQRTETIEGKNITFSKSWQKKI